MIWRISNSASDLRRRRMATNQEIRNLAEVIVVRGDGTGLDMSPRNGNFVWVRILRFTGFELRELLLCLE